MQNHHLFIFALFGLAYLAIGAIVFHHLESGNEESVKDKLNKYAVSFLGKVFLNKMVCSL